MIITNVIGGLGNQMFQYACGRALSIRTGQPLRIAVDQFSGYSLHRGLELKSVFGLEVAQATKAELKQVLGWQAASSLRRLIGRPSMAWMAGRYWCSEPHFKYWPGINEVQAPAYLHGYWQSARYFDDVEDQIRKDFCFRTPWDANDRAVVERMRAQPSISLHVRRGDYTHAKNRSVYALCDVDYYRDAIRAIRQRVPDARIYAFSDDPDWVDAQLRAECGPMEIVSHNVGRSGNDMRLMSQADHHIIANSSFSWWGAWLNPSPHKIVIAPSRWFVNDTDDRDLIPSSWIRI